ncbi:MAG: hypothetical protein R2867_05460 [Caldilineaceae bacterium]
MTAVSIIVALVMSAIPRPTVDPSLTIDELVRRGVDSVSAAPTAESSELPAFDLEAQLGALSSSVSTAHASAIESYAIRHYVGSDGLDWAGNETVGWAQCSWTRSGEALFVGEPSLTQWWNTVHLDKFFAIRDACGGQPEQFSPPVTAATYSDGRPAVNIMNAIYACNEVLAQQATSGIGAAARQTVREVCGLN